MIRAVRASETELVTVALRRFHPGRPVDDVFGPLSELDGITLVPNTSGAMDAREAVRAALLGRELSGSPFVKLEIHPNPHHLLPDPIETYEAAKILAAEGFFVLPYMPADPVLAKRLEEVGCAAVMPLGAAIGSGQGLTTLSMLKLIIRDAAVPVIVDAGLRSPSEAAQAMEIGRRRRAGQQRHCRGRRSRADGQGLRGGRPGRPGRLARRADAQERTAVATSPLTAFLAGGTRVTALAPD